MANFGCVQNEKVGDNRNDLATSNHFLGSEVWSVELPKTAIKPIKVSVDIRAGPASLAQKAAWRKFWKKLIAEAQRG